MGINSHTTLNSHTTTGIRASSADCENFGGLCGGRRGGQHDQLARRIRQLHAQIAMGPPSPR